ncbi:MAG: alpha/beta hydrolase [Burkholderiaceae bacterium]
MLDKTLLDPDGQMPMPFQAAEDYAEQVMGWAQQALPEDITVTADLIYGEHRLQRYDVYAPRGARQAPALVFWHGGGWTNGYRAYVRFMAPHVTRLGMALVAPSYRLAPEHPLPAALDDALQLLRALQTSLAPLGADPRQLYLSGHSAGGHIATLAALRRDQQQRIGLPDACVRGCLPISGIMDLYHPAPLAGSLEERVYTMVLRDPAQDAVMSPLCWSVGNRMPMLLSFGEHDSERVMRSNRRLFELLRLQDGPVQCRVEAGQDHFQTHTALNDAAHPWYAALQRLTTKGTP